MTILALVWLVFYENGYSNLYLHFTGALEEPLAGEAIASSIVQMGLGLTLIGLALGLVKLGYENIQEVRYESDAPTVEPSDD